ncbi:MAG: preprotein translocase subunit SecE [Dactylosporangium sp.]|nr:preprotein translocase subunit SecE [Dactylosporangium sp.]NNJ61441.1 preprotein translocase subunit SecE [Dactylosporangium sp.]
MAADANEAVSDDDADSGSSKKRASGGGTTTISRPKQTKTGSTTRTGVFGIFARLFGFVREVVAELRKVIWPTRVELITYTTVVVVFVTIMLTIVGLFDLGFAKAVLWVFGSGSTSSAE